MNRQHGTLASGHSGRISKKELEAAFNAMDGYGLKECDIYITEWSDTKLVQLALVDSKGDWIS